MFDHVLLGRFIQGNSFIHRLDPRTKLFASFYFIVLALLANNWWTYGLAGMFVLLGVLSSGISLKYFLDGLRPMLFMVLFTVVFQVFFSTGGEVYFEWGVLKVTSAGVRNAVFIFIRLVLIISMSTLLTLTTSPLQLTDGIESVLRPLEKVGFPAHDAAMMLSIALRYVPTLLDETSKIMNAQRARGVEFNHGSLRERIQAMVSIMVPLFVSAFNRAEETALAMEVRGYRGGEGRTTFRELSFKREDAYVLVALLVLTTGMVFLRNG